jgi:muconolactone delta-isomerase
MKVKLDVTPDLAAMMAAEIKAGEKAVSAATREAGTSLKTAWRAQITGAGLGRRLANSIRSRTYPRPARA